MRALLLAALVATAMPDILEPGHKAVRHELVLLWDATDTAHTFVASPTHGFHGNLPIRRGEPFRFSTKYGTRIHAVPAAATLPDARERLENAPWPNSPVPVHEVRSVPNGHPLARVETTLQIVRVTADGIDFERVGERRFDAHGHEVGDLDWLPLALIAAGGAFWIWRLGRGAAAAASA